MQIQERDYDILAWIDHMGFSHLDQLKKACFEKARNPKRAPYRRILKLMEAGLVGKTKVYSDPRDLYTLTKAGVALLRSLHFQYVPGLPKDKRFKNYEHDKGLIELRILALELGLGIWVPERVIRSVKPRGSSPDALLMTASENYAIEYELHPKEPLRYRKIFDRYAEKEKYDGVLYILPSESRIEKMREKIPYIPKKIYFISEERFFQEKDKAVFYSSSDGLPLKQLIYWSRTGPIEELDREELKGIIQSESPDAWKERKPFIPFGGGGSRKDGGDHDSDLTGEGKSSIDPPVDPPINPKEDKDSENNKSEVDMS